MVQSLTQNEASETNHDMGEIRLNSGMVHGSEILDGQKLGSWGREPVAGSPSVSGAGQTR